ncbi:MAG TPA: hypothetical protein DCG12_13775 [Planctomycetaceae bacterium]|nr:hypothetical protein [Planctomycetaceae bacterium]
MHGFTPHFGLEKCGVLSAWQTLLPTAFVCKVLNLSTLLPYRRNTSNLQWLVLLNVTKDS